MTTSEASNEDAAGMTPPRTGVGEEVLLVVPALPEHWAVVRMTASALAARLDFSFEGIEDLRLAVTELCGSCADHAGPSAQCECRFVISDHRLEMYCQVSPVSEDLPAQEDRLMSKLELSQQILRATVDEHEISPVQGGIRRGFLWKERAPGVLGE